jgi:branched-chain amino acid transport system ATP-binding protein
VKRGKANAALIANSTLLKARGRSILVIDKNVEHLTRVCDRHHIIACGRTVWSGTSKQRMAEPDLRRRYLAI